MSEVTILHLEPQLQKQVESARIALDRGRSEQALELCAAVLAVQPNCLQVRKLERAAQLKLAAIRRSLVAKFISAVSTAPFLFSGNLKLKDDPRSALAMAERLLRRDPQSVAALHLLGQAATELGWSETAVFAHESASDLEPERPDLIIALGNAYLAVGRVRDAVSTATHAVQLMPHDVEARTLLQNALVAAGIADGRWGAGAEPPGIPPAVERRPDAMPGP